MSSYEEDLEKRCELYEKQLIESRELLCEFIVDTLDVWYAAKALASIMDRIDRHYLDEVEKELPPEVRTYLQNSISQLNGVKNDETVNRLLDMAQKVRYTDDYGQLRDAVRTEGERLRESTRRIRGRKHKSKK
jgi:hypothetical protein